MTLNPISNMNNIHNFANRQLCEYASIFPNVASLLDHMLFVIGNEYEFDSKKGMIYQPDNGSRQRYINEYPAMTDAEWDDLLAACHKKELKFAIQFARGEVDEEKLVEACAKYKRVSITDEMLTEDALHSAIVENANDNISSFMEKYYRPYPFSKGYSAIYDLNKNTPKWFVQIALNFCRAWVRFLNSEIENNHVWIKPSLQPKTAQSAFLAEAMTELAKTISEGDDYDGWLDDKEEPESEYGDLTWTTKHRDELVVIVSKLEGFLNE